MVLSVYLDTIIVQVSNAIILNGLSNNHPVVLLFYVNFLYTFL